MPYAKNLASTARSRRLLHSKCLQTGAGQASIRGTRILVSSVDMSGTQDGAGVKVSEIRRYSAQGGGSSVIDRQSFGEESNLFGQVAQDERAAWTVRTGIHQANTFVRIPFGGGDTKEVRAFRTLGTGFAYTSDAGSLYVELQDPSGCSDFDAVPCRIVAATADPFGSTAHALTPELTVAYAGTPQVGKPLAFSGALTRRIVAGGEQLRVDPVTGVSVDLRARVGDEPGDVRRHRPHGDDRRRRGMGDHAPVTARLAVVHGGRGDARRRDLGRARDGGLGRPVGVGADRALRRARVAERRARLVVVHAAQRGDLGGREGRARPGQDLGDAGRVLAALEAGRDVREEDVVGLDRLEAGGDGRAASVAGGDVARAGVAALLGRDRRACRRAAARPAVDRARRRGRPRGRRPRRRTCAHARTCPGSNPTSRAAPAIVAGSSGSSPPMIRTRSARRSASARSGACSRAATTAAHAGAEAALRGRCVVSMGIPKRSWIMPRARAWTSGGNTASSSAGSSESTTMRSVHASWSPYSQRRRQRFASDEKAHGHVGIREVLDRDDGAAHARWSFLYVIRCGRSASAPSRSRRCSS